MLEVIFQRLPNTILLATSAMIIAILLGVPLGFLAAYNKGTISDTFIMILAISGITLMLGDSLTSGQMIGNVIAFIMPISFAVLIIIVRKYPTVDMIPLQLIAGLVAMIIGYVVAGRVDISLHDIFLGFLAGFFQVGFGFIFITIGARTTPSAVVGIIMMSEAIFGPLWAWIFINEKPPLIVLIGGSIVLSAVLLQFVSKFFIKKEVN